MNRTEIVLPNREKLALAGQGLEVMSEGDVIEILNCLEEMGGDDPTRLMRRVLFYLKGRVWGESLFVAKKGELLPKEEIMMEIMAVCASDDVSLMYEAMAGAMEGVVSHGHDTLLYLAMIADLGGNVAVERARDFLILGGWSKNELEEGEKVMPPFYLATAGRNVWEWEDNLLMKFLPYFYTIWKNGMRSFSTIFDEEAKAALSTGLKDLRVRLRDISRILIDRGVVYEGRGVSDGTNVVDYKTLLELSSYH